MLSITESLSNSTLEYWSRDIEASLATSISIFFSRSIVSIPMHCLLRANGSAEPVGCMPIAKNPAIVSILSIIESIAPSIVEGTVSPLNLGI